MNPCDKNSADPAKHNGPFQPKEKPFESDGEIVSIERCDDCGNIVFRKSPASPPSSPQSEKEN
jgi:hypothetical protein